MKVLKIKVNEKLLIFVFEFLNFEIQFLEKRKVMKTNPWLKLDDSRLTWSSNNLGKYF